MSIMTRKSQRKLFLFGKYSLALLPPKKWLTELGIKQGDNVMLELDRSRRRIVVRLSPAELTDKPSQPKSDVKKSETGEEWESIPEL